MKNVHPDRCGPLCLTMIAWRVIVRFEIAAAAILTPEE
ncbi:MAG: hypothetical protein GQF41_0297 [Candidatus Rifleibacterium amylolyticum]|nr:MAG: hypothetical protein GQF41_0297 [Candidatus Rifleibacterium amylolyticum]